MLAEFIRIFSDLFGIVRISSISYEKGGCAVFKLRISQYINRNLVEKELTYKQLAERSGVPASSIHSYAQGKTGNPNEDNLIRIAAAFGDPPEVIAAI